MPTPARELVEKNVSRGDVLRNYPDSFNLIDRVIASYEGLKLDSESITFRDGIGYILRYNIFHASSEEVDLNPALRSILVLSTKDFKNIDVTTYSGFDFPGP